MANDWIAMRENLADEPEVLGMADELGIDPQDVVGRLHNVWSWSSAHTSDGCPQNVRKVYLDQRTRTPGFADAMRNVGWLEVDENDRFSVPDFDRWLSNGGKRRMQDSQRKRLRRSVNGPKSVRKTSASKADKKRTTEQNRTEQKTKVTPPPIKTSTHIATPALADDEGEGEEFDFSEVRKRLDALGVNNAQRVLDECPLTPSLAREHIEHFERFPKAWGVGLLVWRLKNCNREQDGGEGWPDKSEAWRQQHRTQVDKRQTAKRAKQRTNTAEQIKADTAEREALEAKHGAALDAMDKDDRLALLPTGSELTADTAFGRVAMLRALDQAQEASA